MLRWFLLLLIASCTRSQPVPEAPPASQSAASPVCLPKEAVPARQPVAAKDLTVDGLQDASSKLAGDIHVNTVTIHPSPGTRVLYIKTCLDKKGGGCQEELSRRVSWVDPRLEEGLHRLTVRACGWEGDVTGDGEKLAVHGVTVICGAPKSLEYFQENIPQGSDRELLIATAKLHGLAQVSLHRGTKRGDAPAHRPWRAGWRLR